MNHEQDQLAHTIAYRQARTLVEYGTTTVSDAPLGVRPDPVAHGWNDLGTPIKDPYERARFVEAIKYLDSRQLLQRHPSRPLLARVLDAPTAPTAPTADVQAAAA